MKSRVLFTLLLAAGAASARAADDPAAASKPAQGPFVVLVGVGRYTDPAIQPRPTADADAKAVYALLADPKYFGAKKDRIVLLTSEPDDKRGGRKATKENIIKAMHEAVAATGKDDTVLIGLFGRGAPAGDKTALFAVDSTVKDRVKDAVLGSDIGTELKAGQTRKIALFMDVAFKGFDAGKETLAEPTLRDLFGGVFAAGEDRDENQVIHDKVVVLSTIPANPPLAKGDHGLLAATLIDALKGAADTDGYEADGLVTVDEVAKYLEKEVTAAARAIGKTNQEKESVPFIVGEEVSHFPVTTNPAARPLAEKRAAAVANLAAAGKLTKEVAEEGADLLTRMPKLKTQQELRKEFQKLADGTATPEAFAAARTKLKESMKLSADAAETFAKKVGGGIHKLKSFYIKVLNDGELTAAAVRGLYRRLEEKLPTDLEDELKSPKTLTADRQTELLKLARLRLGKREDLDGDKDADTALMMMTASLNDPYTVYLDRETIRKEESRIKSQYSGIGIHIRRDLARDGLLCVAPIKGSPAYKAGLLAGDLITEIRREVDPDGKPLKSDAEKVISTKGMKTETALEIILGKPGVPVTVVVEREGLKGPKAFTIERGRVSLETVLGVKRDEKDDWNYWIDEENKIAYVLLTQFGPKTYDELRRVLESLNRKGAKGLVLDLRYNPGGMLTSALLISDLFVESGKLLSVRPRKGAASPQGGPAREEAYYAQSGGPFGKLQVAVLLNNGSASASEIVAATLKDYGKGVVVGERSYGKGSVQTIVEYDPTGGEFKMTTARYFPPLDANIDKLSTSGKPDEEWGVSPNKGLTVELTREERAELAEVLRDKELIQRKDLPPKTDKKPFADKQLDAALKHLKGEAGVKTAKK